VTEPYPRFSEREMARRRAAIEAVMDEHGVAHLLVYGANRFGSAVGWLTRWPVTREALVVVTPGERDVLLVDFYNHVPNATRIATECDVRPAAPLGIATAVEELRARGAAGARVGLIGPLGHRAHARLADLAGEVVALDAEYTRLRLVKSAEELDWLRVGCALTDAAVEALRAGARPGVDERELGALVEGAYVARGGTTHIHYFAATPMAAPAQAVPAQWPSTRRLQAGDALTCEISAAWFDHPGQLLRTFAVDAEPTPRSTRSPPWSARARRRPTSWPPRASSRTPASRPATTSCTASSAATCRPCSARRAGSSPPSPTSRSPRG